MAVTEKSIQEKRKKKLSTFKKLNKNIARVLYTGILLVQLISNI
jgi:hypothetical protein